MKAIITSERSMLKRNRKKKEQKRPMIKKIVTAVSIVSVVQLLFIVPVFASSGGASVIQSGFSTLLDIVKALVSAIGTIVLLWGLFEWGTSLQSPNGAEQSSAFKRIGGGLVMILAPQLISLFVS